MSKVVEERPAEHFWETSQETTQHIEVATYAFLTLSLYLSPSYKLPSLLFSVFLSPILTALVLLPLTKAIPLHLHILNWLSACPQSTIGKGQGSSCALPSLSETHQENYHLIIRFSCLCVF